MPKPMSVTKQKRTTFLEALAERGNVSQAARLAGVPRWRFYELRKEDAEFSREWHEALRISEDLLEAEAVRRAVEGIEEPYYYQGEQRGMSRKYSDTLLMFLLKSRHPERFGAGASSLDNGDDDLGAMAGNVVPGPVVFELHLGGEPDPWPDADVFPDAAGELDGE